MRTMWPRKTKPKAEESEVALQEAKKNLERIRRRTNEVRKVSEASRTLLNENGFAQRLEGIMGG